MPAAVRGTRHEGSQSALRIEEGACPFGRRRQRFAELQRDGGTVADILPELGVLAAMAAVLIAAGAVALRRAVARAM